MKKLFCLMALPVLLFLTSCFSDSDSKKDDPAPQPAVENYSVIFDTAGKCAMDPLSVPDGTVVELSDYVPSAEGFSFDGWFAENTFENQITSVTVAGSDVTVYAKWTEIISVWDGTSKDRSWYGDGSAAEYTISTGAELAGLADIVNDGTDDFSGKTVVLAKDIALGEDGKYDVVPDVVYGQTSYAAKSDQYILQADAAVWTPIGSGTATSNSVLASGYHTFAGIFDGNGKRILNVYTGVKQNGSGTQISNTDTVQGLFGIVSGTVKNLTVTGLVSAKIVAGGIAAYLQNGGKIENCTNRAVVFADGGTTPNGGTENGISRGGAAGGIVGNVMDNTSVTGCLNYGNVLCVNTCKGGRAGGIIGLIDNSTHTVVIRNCGNNADVLAYQYAGGIVGMDYSKNAPISCCYNRGTVRGTSSGKAYVGGIVSQCFSDIDSCYNTGTYKITIDGTGGDKGAHFAGIVSDLMDSSKKVTNCYNTGNIAFSCASNPTSTLVSSTGAICGTGYGYTVAALTVLNSFTSRDIASLAPYTAEDLKFCIDNGADNISVKTEEEMKDAAFIDLLNNGGSNFAEDTAEKNGGLPVLAWENE